MATTSQQIVVTIGGVPTILDVDANLWGTGTVASRPASGDNVGDIYIVQDPPLYRIDVWNGAAWVKATVVGPTGGSTDNALVRWDGAGGDILNNSVITVDDTGNMTGVGTINGNPAASPAQCPDFAGLTRTEWTVKTLEDLTHLDPIDSITSLGKALTASNTGTARPTFRTDGALGPCIRCDGTDDELVVTGASEDWSDLTLFVLFDQQSLTPIYRGPFSAKTSGAAHTSHAVELYESSSSTFVCYVNRDATGGYWLISNTLFDVFREGPVLLTVAWGDGLNPADNPVRVNDVIRAVSEPAAVNGISSTIQDIHLGRGYNVGFLSGDLYTIVAYSGRQMTADEKDAVARTIRHNFNAYPEPVVQSMTWRFDEATAAAAPYYNGWFRLNNATPTSVTSIYLHEESLGGLDTTDAVTTMRAGDYLYLQSRTYTGRFHLFQLSGTPTDNTTYLTIPVTHIDGSTANFHSGEDVYLRYWPGDVLHTGASGEINALTAKTSPVSPDVLVIEDSAASYAKKKVNVAQLPYIAKTGIAADVMTRWSESASDVLQSTGIGVTDTDQMSGIRTASLAEELITYASSLTIDWNDAATQWVILEGSPNITFTAPPAGTRVMLKLIQDNAGSRTVTWPSSIRWFGGAAPSLAASGGDVDFITFYYDGGVYWASAAGSASWDLMQEFADSYDALLLWGYTETGSGYATVAEILSEDTAFSTSHSITLPSVIDDGDLLLVTFSYGLNDTNVSATEAGWTEVLAPVDSTNVVTAMQYLKRADGTETTFDITLSASSLGRAHVHRFPKGTWYDDGTIANAYSISGTTLATGTAANPPSHASGTSRQWVWIAFAAYEEDGTISGYPTSYDAGQTETRTGAGGTTATVLASAYRENTTATEDPSFFTYSLSQEHVAWSIAIRPNAGLVFDRGPNKDNGVLTSITQGGTGLVPSSLKSVATSGPTGYANVAAMTGDVTATHSVLSLFNFTAAATLWDIDDTSQDQEMLISTGTVQFYDGTNRDTGRAEAAVENQTVLMGYTRTSTTNIDLYENGLKWRSLTTATFSTQTAPEVSHGATNTGTNASDGDMGLFAILNSRLSADQHYDVWKKLTGQKHLWKEFVVPNGLDANCEQYLVLWEQAGTQLLDISGNLRHGLVSGSPTLGVAGLDDYHPYCIEGEGTASITTNNTAINILSTTTWTIAGICRSDADGDGIFAFGATNNVIGLASIATNVLRLYASDGSAAQQDITKPSGDFAWCVRRNGGTLDWWVNGIQQTAVNISAKTFSSSTAHYLMGWSSIAGVGNWDGTFQHRGTYSAALPDTICELLGEINLVDQTPVI